MTSLFIIQASTTSSILPVISLTVARLFSQRFLRCLPLTQEDRWSHLVGHQGCHCIVFSDKLLFNPGVIRQSDSNMESAAANRQSPIVPNNICLAEPNSHHVWWDGTECFLLRQ
ncbi:hypothetical protein TNCV_3730411 [Trichonephila clavipes]|nr:hypothetical protein TNCV_3730411 [Trichonephila clavipes]